MNTELIPIGINEIEDPTQIIKQAEVAAKALIDIVSRKQKPVILNGEQYLEYEDWQTLGRFYQVTAKIASTQYVEFGDFKGFEASADAIHAPTGNIIASAQSMCLNDETHWAERKGIKVPLFQLRSMAQTRACAKALRSCLSWVAVLAGYKPTPAEEMTGAEVQEAVGPVEEFDFAIKRKETTGDYGKPLEYWNRWDEVIAAGLAVEFSKSTKAGKQYKAWRTNADNLDLAKPLKVKAVTAESTAPQVETEKPEPLITKEQLIIVRDILSRGYNIQGQNMAKWLKDTYSIEDVKKLTAQSGGFLIDELKTKSPANVPLEPMQEAE